MKRHFLALLLSLTMIISLLPVTAKAEGEQEDELVTRETETPSEPATSGNCGATEDDKVTWSFDSDTGVLTISGTGAMADWKAHGKNASTACGNEAANVSDTTCEVSDCYLNRPWQSYKDQITKVVIKQGVTTIGSHAFFLCSNLESVSIPEGVTTIEDRAFWQTSLKNITIPASVTQIGSTIKEVFYQCYNLEDITVASGNTAYKSVDGVLYTADGTTLIQYPQNKADTSYKMIDEATKIDFLAFNYTQNLQTIDFNNVTEFADKAVYGNQALQEIVLKNAASLGNQAFSGNKEVTSVLLEKAQTTVGESVFSSCTSLTNVTLPDDMKELQDGMFAFCTALKTLKFPAQLNRIGKACFDRAGLAGDLVIPESVENIGFVAFRNCHGLTSITVEGNPTFSKGDKTYAFQYCNNLLWMKANFNIIKQVVNITTPDQYKGETFEPQNSSWFTADGKEVGSSTNIDQETTFYRWFTKKVLLNANGGQNNGDIQEVYAFFAPALGETKTIQFPSRYNRGQVSYVVKVDDTKFTRDGYTFKEWTGDAAGEKPYEIGKHIYNYMPDAIYAQWSKVIDEDTYFVSPVIADQTYTGSALEPAVKVTKNGEVISDTEYSVKYSSNTNVGTATATVKVGDTVIGTATFNIVKATPTLTITASPASLRGVGKVTLTVSGVPSSEGTAAVTCDNGITVDSENGTYSAVLPNRTVSYTFTANYDESTNYTATSAKCEVSVTRRYSSPSTPVTPEPEPTPEETVRFADVSTSAYYYDAVKWAVENGVTDGLSATTFGPYESCTRAQIVTFLWRTAGSPEPKAMSSFTDVPASAYYAKAVAWAVENGITNGMTETAFAPDATCTRGQSVTFLYRALKGTASGSTNFTDVPADAFYADAVSWAVANKVTDGTSATTFSPNADCTRAEIVTFLYRAYQGK